MNKCLHVHLLPRSCLAPSEGRRGYQIESYREPGAGSRVLFSHQSSAQKAEFWKLPEETQTSPGILPWMISVVGNSDCCLHLILLGLVQVLISQLFTVAIPLQW